MKTKVVILSRTLIVLLFILLFPLQSLGQCGEVSITVNKEDSPCSNNGKIEVLVTGEDIDNGKYFGLQYRVYRSGIDPEIWADQHVRVNLPAGTYKIDIRGKCVEAGGGYVEVPNAVPAVTITQADWAILNMEAEVLLDAFECMAEGQVKFTSISGGVGPYTLKMTTYPATYTGVKEKNFTTVASINNVTWDNLTAGTYVFTLSESSACASTAKTTVEVKKMTLAALPNLFSSLYSYKSYYSTATELENNYALTAYCGYSYTEGSEYYKYLKKVSQYLEYTTIYPEDGAPNPLDVSHVWTTLPNYTGSSYKIPLTNLRYDVDQIRSNQVNKKPQVYVRVKGCTDITRIFTINLNTSTPSLISQRNGCDNHVVSSWYKTMPINYPASWELSKETIRNSGNYDVVQSGTALSFQNMPANNQYFTSENVGGFRYKYKVTSASGLEFTSSVFDFSIQNPASVLTSTYSSFGCDNLDVAPFFYLSTGNRMADIVSLKLLAVEKTTNGGAYVVMTPADPDYSNIVPSFPDWKKADLTPGLLTPYTLSIALWANSLDETVVSTTAEATIRAKGNVRTLPRERTRYRFKYEVTDVCGTVNSSYYILAGQKSYYDYNEPQFVVNSNCGTSWELSIPNIISLISVNQRNNSSAYYSISYVRIVAGPAGGYSSGSYEYIRYANQSIKLTKPGTYTVKVGLNETNTSAIEECAAYYQLVISEEDTSFELNGNLTAAYRCQNSAMGDGYIKLAVKNGSGGPYSFELSQYDNNINDFVSIETNTTGEFQNWLEKNSDSYKVRVTDSGCSTVRSFEQKLDVLNLSNVPISWVENYNVCPGGTIKLHALALGATTYQWTGPNGWTSNEKDPVIDDVAPEHSGIYTVTVMVPFCGGETMAGSVSVSVGIPTLYWNPAATDGNWFNNNNWLQADGTTSSGHPSPCTTIHIPGNADHYPNLSELHSPLNGRGLPNCDTIIYHYGGETAYPTRLVYKGAKVQYNFGYYGTGSIVDGSQPTLHADTDFPQNGGRPISTLKRGQWYMLSAPLKSMTSGDFSFGGYPSSYQRLYNVSNPVTNLIEGVSYTRPFEKYNTNLGTANNALAVTVVPYKNRATGAGDHKHLESLEGIVEIPYINNEVIKAKRPLHKYDPTTKKSSFTYYNIETLAPIATKVDDIERSSEVYRFIYEKANNKPETIIEGANETPIYKMALAKPFQGGQIMIGNPLMSHIDFDKLYSENSGVIKNYYSIIEAESGDALTYTIGGGGAQKISKDIAPLQGFIVDLVNPAVDNQELIFYMDGIKSVVSFGAGNIPLAKPRSLISNEPTNWVRIESITIDTIDSSPIKDVCRLLFGVKDAIDVPKISEAASLSGKADIFLIDERRGWCSDLNKTTAQSQKTYDIGVLTTYAKDITLNINPGGDQIGDVKLVDTYLNKTIDVTNGGNYTFEHRNDLFSGGRKGMDVNRFKLIVTLKK